jgi:hypothetical protein
LLEFLYVCRFIDKINIDDVDLRNGKITITFALYPECYYSIISQLTGLEINDEYSLVSTLKELAYKKSLKEDKLLDMYRKRYMSLASSVSHYGTDSAIKRFEEYKKDGVIMKAKYLNKEISSEEFENWISSSKKQKSIY